MYVLLYKKRIDPQKIIIIIYYEYNNKLSLQSKYIIIKVVLLFFSN